MNKVFEPGEMELADPRGDPNRVIEIQHKVQELLEANRQRREGVRQEILDQGAWALPGLINATFVWMNRLESEQAQVMLATLMVELARGNAAGMDLLFRVGALETPFAVPRSIARRALEQLAWKPTDKNLLQLEQQIRLYRGLDDIPSMLDLYALSVLTGDDRQLSIALDECRQWAKRRLKQSGDLLALLIRAYPGQVEKILTKIILALQDEYRDESVADNLVRPLSPIPGAWLQDGVLLGVSNQVLRQLRTHRHTTIEYLWIHAVQDYKKESPRLWQNYLHDAGNQIKRNATEPESIYRYWFRALHAVNEMDYIIEQTLDKNDDWGTMAALDLLFLSRRQSRQPRQLEQSKRALQALQDLETSDPVRFRRANELFSRLVAGSKEEGEIVEGRGAAGLTLG